MQRMTIAVAFLLLVLLGVSIGGLYVLSEASSGRDTSGAASADRSSGISAVSTEDGASADRGSPVEAVRERPGESLLGSATEFETYDGDFRQLFSRVPIPASERQAGFSFDSPMRQHASGVTEGDTAAWVASAPPKSSNQAANCVIAPKLVGRWHLQHKPKGGGERTLEVYLHLTRRGVAHFGVGVPVGQREEGGPAVGDHDSLLWTAAFDRLELLPEPVSDWRYQIRYRLQPDERELHLFDVQGRRTRWRKVVEPE